jgi:hypothetical protein
MSSSSTKKALTTVYPALRRGIQNVQRDVFGQYPQLNGQTGHQMNKTQLKSVYLSQYYMDPIEKFARMVRFMSSLANFACFVDGCGLLQNKIKRIHLASRISNEELSLSVGLCISAVHHCERVMLRILWLILFIFFLCFR